jgi:hypothetical protein
VTVAHPASDATISSIAATSGTNGKCFIAIPSSHAGNPGTAAVIPTAD